METQQAQRACDICGTTIVPEGCTTGYGTTSEWSTYGPDKVCCFACCAIDDKATMIRDGKATLYLTVEQTASLDGRWIIKRAGYVGNWPGSLRFPVPWVNVTKVYGIERKRTTFRFIGPDGAVWSGVNKGTDNQLARCKRTKLRRITY